MVLAQTTFVNCIYSVPVGQRAVARPCVSKSSEGISSYCIMESKDYCLDCGLVHTVDTEGRILHSEVVSDISEAGMRFSRFIRNLPPPPRVPREYRTIEDELYFVVVCLWAIISSRHSA